MRIGSDFPNRFSCSFPALFFLFCLCWLYSSRLHASWNDYYYICLSICYWLVRCIFNMHVTQRKIISNVLPIARNRNSLYVIFVLTLVKFGLGKRKHTKITRLIHCHWTWTCLQMCRWNSKISPWREIKFGLDMKWMGKKNHIWSLLNVSS